MQPSTFRSLLIGLATLFTGLFAMVCIPPFLQNPDIVAAFGGGFANPFATAYSLDVIFCWLVLATWVFYEAKTQDIKHGWLALLLGLVPGVAVGFSAYLLLRLGQQRGA